jgi:prevent-host-death family protein
MDEIGAFEAKNTLSALLDRVERGEEIVITRRGRPVAKLVPSGRKDTARAIAAAARIRDRAKALRAGRFNWFEWKSYRDEGRR